MRFSFALLPFVTTAVALPVAQPVARIRADLITLPELNTILGGLPQIDVSDVLTKLNTTLHGALPTVPPAVIAQIQGIFDSMHDGAQLTGNHAINAAFAAKADGFNWGHGDGGHGEGGMGGMGGDFDIPPWLLELIGQLIDLIGQLGGGPISGPTGGSAPPIGIPTTVPMPPTEIPSPTDIPTDGPFPPTVSTGIPTFTTALPVPTGEPSGIPTDDLPTDDLPTDEPTEPASTDRPTDIESTEDPSSTLAPVPTVTNTFPTVPPPSETETETEIDTGSGTAIATGSASSTGTAPSEEESDLPISI